jgi:uncharacterized membrane protein (UPF0136 family)
LISAKTICTISKLLLIIGGFLSMISLDSSLSEYVGIVRAIGGLVLAIGAYLIHYCQEAPVVPSSPPVQ